MKIQLKRSNQLDGGSAKKPSIGYMEYGELAVNFNTADPAIFVRASDGAGNDSIVRIAGSGAEAGGMPSGPSDQRPGSPSPGDLYFDTTISQVIYWNGTSWQAVSPSTVVADGTVAPPNVNLYPEGTLWYNSAETEGNLYILYNDPAPAAGLIWVAVGGGGGGIGDDFWDRNGTNLSPVESGDNLTDIGSITATGGLSVDGTAFSSPIVEGKLNGTNTSLLRANGDLLIGGDAGNNPNILLSNNGSITANNFITADYGFLTTNKAYGGNFSVNVAGSAQDCFNATVASSPVISIGWDGGISAAGGKFKVESTGQFTFEPEADAGKVSTTYSGGTDNSTSIIGKNKDGTETWRIKADGSITAAGGSFQVDGSGIIQTNINSAGNIYLDSTASFASPKITLDAASGNIFSGGFTSFTGAPTNTGVGIFSAGVINTVRDTGKVFESYNTGDADPKISFSADGSIAAAGNIDTGDLDATGGGVRITADGQFFARPADSKPGTSNSIALYSDGSSGANETFSVTKDGSITAANSVLVGGDTFAGANVGAKMALGSCQATAAASSNAVWLGYTVGNSSETSRIDGSGNASFSGTVTAANVTFNLEPENSANYTSTADAEGNSVQVYNGPTLDIKDRIQNLISRMDAIEADEINDDATSSALLTLVAGLSSDMQKTKAALVAIRAASNVAGTLEELKSSIATATADI